MLQRELKVAFSTAHQPVWMRAAKWIVIISVVVKFHDARFFWPALAGVIVGALLLHSFYRWKTRGWTQAWGGWNDVD